MRTGSNVAGSTISEAAGDGAADPCGDRDGTPRGRSAARPESGIGLRALCALPIGCGTRNGPARGRSGPADIVAVRGKRLGVHRAQRALAVASGDVETNASRASRTGVRPERSLETTIRVPDHLGCHVFGSEVVAREAVEDER